MVKRRGMYHLIADLVGVQAQNDDPSSENGDGDPEDMNMDLKNANLINLPISIVK